ncbi:MAG: isochorismatase family protein [Caulobacteraceae bacterium]
MDMQREYVVPGRPAYAAGNPEVAMACRRVLDFAREEGWRVVHSQLHPQSRTPDPRTLFAAPIEGLRPLISEPVFFRRGLSAFANPAFGAELAEARGDEVFLIGFSLGDTCLATALAAIDAGLSLTLLEDAVGAGEGVDVGEVARKILSPFVRIASSRALERRDLEALS